MTAVKSWFLLILEVLLGKIYLQFISLVPQFVWLWVFFLDRSESPYNHCQIENNSEVIEFLNKKGFTSYKVGQLSFEQQIHLFKNAKVIVGAHGAAFANLAFCNSGTQVIEIKPIHHPNYVSKTIGKIIRYSSTGIGIVPV